MIEYALVFVALCSFSIAVFIDTFLSNKIFESEKALVFYASLTNLLFVPLLWLFGLPKLPSSNIIIPIIVVGVAEILYLYPYYKALRESDTSITVALFSIGKIFVPIMAYFIVNERLTTLQYAGFSLIILSSFFLTYEGGIRINKALGLMILTSIIVSIHATVYKFTLESVDWVTVMTWAAVISTLTSAIIGLMFYRKEILKAKHAYKKSFKQFLLNEFFTFLAMACIIYAYTIIPVTIVQGLLAIHPVIIILLSVLGKKIWPKYFREEMDWKSIVKKSAFFLIMAVGIVMTIL